MKTRIIPCVIASLITSFTTLLPCLSFGQQGDLFNAKNVRIINPGKPLNHPQLDYAPSISPDGKTLYFISDRPGSRMFNATTISHDFWQVVKKNRLDTVFAEPINMDTVRRPQDNGLNTALREGVPSIAANRRTMYFTGCDRPDVIRTKATAEKDKCDIYVVELLPSGEWGIPRNLGPNVNSDYYDGQPSVSPDGMRLYFASNRKGSLGTLSWADIWYCDYDPKNQIWLPAKNAGTTINTELNDWSPYIAANNRELFFASAGHQPNYGGTDFYVSVRDQKDKWSQPKNLGKPINTEANEAFITTPASRDVLYFASQRTDIPNSQGNYDIFMAFVPQSSLSLAIPISGRVWDGCAERNTAATIAIVNPVTKRTFRDTLDGKKRVTFELVLTDFDFGPLDKPVDTLRLGVWAYHAQFGQVSQTLTIVRPKVAANGNYEAMPEIPPLDITFGARPEIAATLQKQDFTPRTSTARLLREGFKGLILEEVVSVSVNRILNYVFFDEGKSTIPERYHTFKTASEAALFDEERLRGETLDKYYHTLNIFGARLKKFPKSTITITGCNAQNSPAEKSASLSKSRAQAVFTYLRDVWGMSEKRMKVQARDLPSVPSNRDDSLGAEENRRVEIVCDDWEIIKPVVDRTPVISTPSPTANFSFTSPPALERSLPNASQGAVVMKTSSGAASTLQGTKRSLVIYRGSKEWRRFDNVSTNGTISWNWKNTNDDFPLGDTALTAVFSVTDKTGRECVSNAVSIPVRRITTDDKKREKVADKTLERYNLIMFPFDKSDVGPMNSRILREYVLPRLAPSSDALVVGHTDVIGSDEYNQTLSAARGAKAKEELARLLTQIKVKTLDSKGIGEAEPLFPNSLPEGRFYNRTVQVIIETPVDEAAKE
jgi:outer membrane protein OmpA-like peptidoglycan-associated protein